MVTGPSRPIEARPETVGLQGFRAEAPLLSFAPAVLATGWHYMSASGVAPSNVRFWPLGDIENVSREASLPFPQPISRGDDLVADSDI